MPQECSCPRANIRGHLTQETSLLEVGICLDSASNGLCSGNPIPSPPARCNIQLVLSSVNPSQSQGPLFPVPGSNRYDSVGLEIFRHLPLLEITEVAGINQASQINDLSSPL